MINPPNFAACGGVLEEGGGDVHRANLGAETLREQQEERYRSWRWSRREPRVYDYVGQPARALVFPFQGDTVATHSTKGRPASFMTSGLNAQNTIQCRARAHRLASELRVGHVIAAEINGRSLARDQFFDNALLVLCELARQRRK